MRELIEKLRQKSALTRDEFTRLLKNREAVNLPHLHNLAAQKCVSRYGERIYVRGLIEISNYCQNDCYYCGIRKSNFKALRYRLTPEQILQCCAQGYEAGFRTFVLQGGEDAYYKDELLCQLIREIKARWPDCALTLSLGEKSQESYAAYRKAGADRYLLRHETADPDHYALLHPKGLLLSRRKECLENLKALGYQVGAGFMVGSPGQSAETLAQDLDFLQALQPEMVGIGPFIPHADTPFAGEKAGTAQDTLYLLSLVRLLLPGALIPATTALSTITANGWEQGVLAGANVIMLNLTPPEEGEKYLLYNEKKFSSHQEFDDLRRRMAAMGKSVVIDRGDYRQG